MDRSAFDKPPLTLDEQLTQLERRGMTVRDRDHALQALKHLNYYRLCAYWLPFEADHDTHTFAAAADFDRVLELYDFDRQLRLLIMDAIERVEISMRSQLAYHLSHAAGAHAHEDAACFRRHNLFQQYLDAIQREVNRSDERFIAHYRTQYGEPATPPIWSCVEVISLGLLSRIIGNLKQRYMTPLTHAYGLPEGPLRSLMHHVSYVRNVAAHHARLWNREFTLTPEQPHRRPAELRDSLLPEAGGGRPGYDPARRLYNTLTYLCYLLSIVAPDDPWPRRIDALIDQYRIERQEMGFPADYADRPLWARVLAARSGSGG